MSIIVVHDPRGLPESLPDGAVFDGPLDQGALVRDGVVSLPVESLNQYSRGGFGAGQPVIPGTVGVCPMLVDMGDSSFPWLYWTAWCRPTGVSPNGYLTLINDTMRRVSNVGLGLTHSHQRIETLGEPKHGGWILKGKLRLGEARGIAGFLFAGTLHDVAIQVVGISLTRTEHAF